VLFLRRFASYLCLLTLQKYRFSFKQPQEITHIDSKKAKIDNIFFAQALVRVIKKQ